jgi:ribosomal protein L29
MIKLSELTSKSDHELNTFITTERSALAQAIIDSRTKEVKGVKILHAHKKTIARALTIQRERQIAGEEATQ